MTSPWHHPKLRLQSGFTLIEVLIAALVLSVGLLGLAGLQGLSLKMNHGSYLRSQAIILSYEIADAMRANRANAASYNGPYPSISCDTSYIRTNTSDIKEDDIHEWQNRLACLLPSGSAKIDVSVVSHGASSPSSVNATITVTWDETRQGGEADQSFTFTTEL